MKNPIPRLAAWLALAALLPFSPALAFDPLEVLPKQVGVLVEYYEVEHSVLPPLIRAYHDAPTADALLEALREMAGKGEARLVESTYVATRTGQRAKIDSIREFIYPTEYEPAQAAENNARLVVPALPTAFEMQPVGNTLEVDPVFGPDGETFDLNYASELVRSDGFSEWGSGPEKTIQPLFHSTRASSEIRMKVGTSQLFGVFTPAEAHAGNGEGKRLLGLLSAISLAPVVRGEWEESRRNPPPDKSPPAARNEPPPPESIPEAEQITESDRKRQIHLFTEFIEMDAALGARLIRELQGCSDATAIRLGLDAVIASGEAKVLESNELVATTGQRVKSESVREFIYPTEYSSPDVPPDVSGGDGKSPDGVAKASGQYFEMRQVGVNVVAESGAVKAGRIEVMIAPGLIGFCRMLTYGTGPSTCPQPLFETMDLQTSVVIPDGTAFLLGMHSLETARAGEAGTEEERAAVRDRRVLVFLTAKVKVVE